MKTEKRRWQDYLTEQLQRFGTSLSKYQIQQLLQFLTLLMQWNKKMNLTAVHSVTEVITKHFLDSLVLVKFADLLKQGDVVDVGTGAGFPGLPLAIAFPQQDFTLIEARKKKCQFLQVVEKKLGLKNVTIINERSELLAKETEHRGKYSNVLCRALGKMSTASELCLPFVKLGGVFIAYRGRSAESEVKEAQQALSLLGGQIKEIKPYSLEADLPLTIKGDKRHLVITEKIKPTPEKYPRRPGIPRKRPLKTGTSGTMEYIPIINFSGLLFTLMLFALTGQNIIAQCGAPGKRFPNYLSPVWAYQSSRPFRAESLC